MRLSRDEIFLQNHSIRSAYKFAVDISTVAGRLRINFLDGVGSQTPMTASQICRAKSHSVPVKLTGEYSNRTTVAVWEASFLILSTPFTARSMMSARSLRNTSRLCSSEVEL